MCLRIAVFCLLIIVLNSCTGDSRQEQKTSDSLYVPVTTDTLLTELKEQKQAFADWQQFYQQRVPAFSLDSFTSQEKSQYELFTRETELPESYYKNYGPLLVYNSDSSLFIDAFSYFLIIEEKDGQLLARGGEPDQEVAVIDPVSKERTRIFFCGPSCLVAKTVWMDDRHIALFGLSSDDGIEGYKPMIWITDITTGNTGVYGYNGNAKYIRPESLLKYLLEQQGIKMEY